MQTNQNGFNPSGHTIKITPELFAFACYQVLIANNGGLADKHPHWMLEKMPMLEAGWDAFQYLDTNNQGRVMDWVSNWHIEVPEKIHTLYRGPYQSMQYNHNGNSF